MYKNYFFLFDFRSHEDAASGTPEESDDDLVKKIQANDQQALNVLVVRFYAKRIYFYSKCLPTIWRRIGEGECNGVFFTTLLETTKSYKPGPAHFVHYFEVALHNNILKMVRDLRLLNPDVLSLDRYVGAQENGTCLADVVPDQGSLLDSPVSYCDKQELNAAETEFIASLSPFEHRIFLEHLEGLSLRSIAEKHGCGVKKVRVSLGHCLTLGRKIFKKHGITDVSL